MKNNELLIKVEKVGYGIFTFFFWYLVIGFFLKSDYPIYEQPFNRADAYEVLRDGMTLSAYILAPAIAVVLFSDWREQHASIKNEKISLEVRNLLNTTVNNMETFPRSGEDHLFDRAIKLHFQNMMTLDRLEKEITIFNKPSFEYVNKLKKINEFNYDCGLVLQNYFFAKKDELSHKDKWDIAEQININVSSLKEMAVNLNPLIVNPE